jgi:hypothetical protein
MVNSQMLSLAMMFASRMLLTQNVTMTPRSATSVKKEAMIATPLLTAKPPVESHTPSAPQVLENAPHAIQRRTKPALKSRKSVVKNASHKRSHFATQTLPSARNAKIHQTQVASQPPDAKRLVATNPRSTNTNAHGRALSQLALRMKRVLRARPSAPNNAKKSHSPSVTSRTTPVLSVNMTRTQLASKPRTTAMLPRKKENASQKN